MLPRLILTLLEQVVNSGIVAGIATLGMLASTQRVDSKAVLITFGLTFLVEMRKYRGLFNHKE